MSSTGFLAWVSSLASASGLTVKVTQTPTEYRADFSDGKSLVYYPEELKVRVTSGKK